MPSTAASDLLTSLLPEWHQLLQGWAADGRLTAAAQGALMLDGEPQRLKELAGQWATGDFSAIPPIVLLSSGDISGAMGAYAISTGTIYLNADWLAAASREQVVAVLTEELGHHLDGLLNAVDTPGDEGEKLAYQLLEMNNHRTPSGTPDFSVPDSIFIKSGSALIAAEASAIPSSEIKTNGDAVLQGSLIDLVSRDNGFGSVWRKTSVDLSKDWSTSFLVEATSGSGTSDGFTFTINGDTSGISALGDGGQNLGFFGFDTKRGISNSYAVLFDMYTTTSASLLGFSASNTSVIPQGSIQLPASLTNNTYRVEINYEAAGGLLNVNIAGNRYPQAVNLASLVGRGAYLGLTAANGGGTMDIRVKEWDLNATAYPMPLLRGNSLYKMVKGPTWENAEANASNLGGYLVKIDSASENAWLSGKSWTSDGSTSVYIGCTDKNQEGSWLWSDGTPVTFSYWRSDSPSNGKGLSQTPNENYGQIVFAPDWLGPDGYYWNDISNVFQPDVFSSPNGIGEVPIRTNIGFSPTAKEGQTLTTTINLSAGTLNTGNLAEGAQVWWKVTGITADDLSFGNLQGNGSILNGQLSIQHGLKSDTPVENEEFRITLYSDQSFEPQYQIGTTKAILIQDAVPMASIEGTPFNDNLSMTAANLSVPSAVHGKEGDDSISAASSVIQFHSLIGGDGNDQISSASSFTRFINGNMGSDKLTTLLNSYIQCQGGRDDDTITINPSASGSSSYGLANGNLGNETIIYNSSVNTFDCSVRGGQGNDIILINPGLFYNDNTQFIGDLGDDVIEFKELPRNHKTVVFGGDGFDKLVFRGGDAQFYKGSTRSGDAVLLTFSAYAKDGKSYESVIEAAGFEQFFFGTIQAAI